MLSMSKSYQAKIGSKWLFLKPLTQAAKRYWLLLVSKAAAYIGFKSNERDKVTTMNSREL